LFDNFIKKTGIIIARTINMVKIIVLFLFSGTSHKVGFNFSITGPSHIKGISTHDSFIIKNGTQISLSFNQSLFHSFIISCLFLSSK
jgi:hypothetical protein